MSDASVVVIGAGQAGLAVGACLRQRGIDAVVLDSDIEVGASWRRRYDSLVLFSPAQYDGLPGVPFPAPKDTYPTKDDVADYLAEYAKTNELDVRPGSTVTRVSRHRDAFTVTLDGGDTMVGDTVVIATGANQVPHVPDFASSLDADVVQLHSSAYRNPASVPDGRLLVVGAGNSGAQIAEELATLRHVVVAYRRLPPRLPQRFLGRDVIHWLVRTGIMHRPSKPKAGGDPLLVATTPLIGSGLPKLVRRGVVERRPRVVDASGRHVGFDDGTSAAVDVVLWATGYRHDFSWIAVDGALAENGAPRHERGVSTVPGLYFVGLPGLHTLGSGFLGFVGRDAEFVADRIADRARTEKERA